MNFLILKVSQAPSKYGGNFYYIFFKGEDGKSYRSCLDPKMRNFSNWKPYLETTAEQNVFLTDLRVMKGNIVDADSKPRKVENVAH